MVIVASLLLRFIPGDPVDVISAGNPGITEDDKELLRDQLGLNEPIPKQVYVYITGLLRGDMGESLRFREPVRAIVFERLPATLELTFISLIIAMLIAVPLGVITATKRDQMADYIGSIVAVLGLSVPSFVLGILMIMFFSVELRILPSSGKGLPLLSAILSADLAEVRNSIRYLILPSIALGVFVAAANARLIRSSMLEVLRQDYVRYARAKGLANRTVILRHALRNALIPVVTVLGLQFGYLLSGAFVIENVFAWPGIGRLSVQAIFWRDYPLIQGVVLVTAVVFLSLNILVDVLYAFIDPRIRLG